MESSDSVFFKIGDIADEVYFLYDTANSNFNYISPSFDTVWEMPAAAVLSNPQLLLDTVHPEDQTHVRESLLEAQQAKRSNKFEFRITPGGATKYIVLKTYPFHNGNTNLIAGIAEDISPLKRNILYAEKINARKNSMLVILAHDLRGPIGIINLMASSIRSNPQIAGDENLLQSVKVIQDLCKNNIELIQNLVSQEFLESPEVDLRKERVDIVWAINDVIQSYKKSEETLSKNFIITSSSPKLYVQIDNLKLMQVFNNLISNAIKFTNDNGLIEVDIKDKHPFVHITVRDNGIGIPDDLQPFLFDKFTRARRTGLKGQEAIGLGMSIIKIIVELHGGRIWFDSKENEGSTFYIELPK